MLAPSRIIDPVASVPLSARDGAPGGRVSPSLPSLFPRSSGGPQ